MSLGELINKELRLIPGLVLEGGSAFSAGPSLRWLLVTYLDPLWGNMRQLEQASLGSAGEQAGRARSSLELDVARRWIERAGQRLQLSQSLRVLQEG